MVIGQDPNMIHFTTTDGLPSNQVYQIYQDRHNFIWFATDAGAARFDGTHFSYFTIKEGLNTNEIIKIQEDSQGRIWFFNFNGTFNFFDGKNVYNYSNAPFLNDIQSKFLFRQMFEDRDKSLYFHLNLNRDIFVLDDQNRLKKIKLPSKKISRFQDDKRYEGRFCMGLEQIDEMYLLFTSGGLFQTSDLSTTLIPVDTSMYIHRVFQDSTNHTFIDVSANNLKKHLILKYKGDRALDTLFFPFRKPGEVINYIIEDIRGHYWVSSHYSGVYCFKGEKLIRHFDIKKPQNILEDTEGNIWISSLGEGVHKYTRHILQQNHLSVGFFDGNGIISACNRQEGGIWAIDGQRLYLIKDNRIFRSAIHFPGSGIDQVAELRNQTIILGESNGYLRALKNIKIVNNRISISTILTDNQLVKSFSVNPSKDEISTFFPFTIYRFDQDNLFSDAGSHQVVTERLYYTHFNARNQLFFNGSRIYLFDDGTLQAHEPLSAFNGRIIRQHVNLSGELELFNIGGDSLYLFDGKKMYDLNHAFIRAPEEQINHMVYHHPYLFLAGNSRIFFCQNPEDALRGKQLVLPTADLNFNNITQIVFDNNQLVVASEDGLSFLPLERLLASKNDPPTPYFRSILINDFELTDSDTEISFYGKSKVRFIMGNIHFGSGKALYTYMLEGGDNKWTTGSGSNIMYTSIGPGSYVFKFKVRTGASGWSDEQVFAFRIRPYWWQHPLLYVFIATTGGLLTFMGFLRWKRNALRKQEIAHQMVMLEQKALQSMMNPHFIFNTLGSIQNYLLRNDSAAATKYLVKFARLIRQNVHSTKASEIRLDEEIDRLRSYLELEQIRMNNRFSFSIESGDIRIEEVMIPAMILQPLVENAVSHGMSEVDSDGRIHIRFTTIDKNMLQIIIEDNGIGINRASGQKNQKDYHLKIGMELTRKRLELIGNKMNIVSSIHTKEAFPGQKNPGTRVEINVPCSLKVRQE
jgi:two-component sensor histidine kinase